MPLLEVEGLSIAFSRYTGRFKQTRLHVIEDLHLSVEAGEIIAVIGASGSGKSLLAHAILGLLPANAHVTGTIRYRGEVLDRRKQAFLRGRSIALIPQAVAALDPLMRVGLQVRIGARGRDPVSAQRQIFRRFGLEEAVERMYPFQLSGGMARKVLFAGVAVLGARLIVADEPTSGMSAQDAREALTQLKAWTSEGAGVILITHDIEAALTVAERVAVFYAGTIVETALAADFSGKGERLRHPYSRAMWQALPQNAFRPLAGTQPHPAELPRGCLFSPRCPLATPACAETRPPVRALRGGTVSCHHAT